MEYLSFQETVIDDQFGKRSIYYIGDKQLAINSDVSKRKLLKVLSDKLAAIKEYVDSGMARRMRSEQYYIKEYATVKQEYEVAMNNEQL